MQILKKSIPRPGRVGRPPQGLQSHHGSKALSEFLPGPLSLWRPEAKLTSSELIGKPTAHCQDGHHTNFCLLASPRAIGGFKTHHGMDSFFLNNLFFFLFFLKCKKHLGTAETDTKGRREGCMQGRALAAAAL